jgi:hypothetical protein
VPFRGITESYQVVPLKQYLKWARKYEPERLDNTRWLLDGPDPAVERQQEKLLPQFLRRFEERGYQKLGVTLLFAQLRHLLYISDGDFLSQRQWIGAYYRPTNRRYSALEAMYLAERWEQAGYRTDLVRTHLRQFSEAHAIPFEAWAADVPSLSEVDPILWDGPAWLVGLEIEGILTHRWVKVYMTPEAEFLCSGWCERSVVPPGNGPSGINLQVGELSLGAWLIGHFLPRVREEEEEEAA